MFTGENGKMLQVNIFRVGLLLLTCLVGIFVCLPLTMLIIQSMSPKPALWPKTFTLQWYRMQGTTIIPAVITSLSISFPATLLAIMVGLPLGRALVRYDFRAKNLVKWGITLPIVIPGVSLGLAYLQIANTSFVRNIPPLAMLIAVHTVLVLPYVAQATLAGYESLEIVLEEASATLGAKPSQTYFRVVLPPLVPFVLAGATIGLARSMNDFIITMFLVQPGLIPLSIQIYRSTSYGTPPLTSALATILLVFSVVFALIAECTVRRAVRLVGER